MPIREITDEQLVKRAMMNARPRKLGDSPRWVAVMDTFALGSGYAWEICKIHGLEPEEIVSGPCCETCDSITEDDV